MTVPLALLGWKVAELPARSTAPLGDGPDGMRQGTAGRRSRRDVHVAGWLAVQANAAAAL